MNVEYVCIFARAARDVILFDADEWRCIYSSLIQIEAGKYKIMTIIIINRILRFGQMSCIRAAGQYLGMHRASAFELEMILYRQQQGLLEQLCHLYF